LAFTQATNSLMLAAGTWVLTIITSGAMPTSETGAKSTSV